MANESGPGPLVGPAVTVSSVTGTHGPVPCVAVGRTGEPWPCGHGLGRGLAGLSVLWRQGGLLVSEKGLRPEGLHGSHSEQGPKVCAVAPFPAYLNKPRLGQQFDRLIIE